MVFMMMVVTVGVRVRLGEASSLRDGELGEEHVVFVCVHEFFGVPLFFGREDAFLLFIQAVIN